MNENFKAFIALKKDFQRLSTGFKAHSNPICTRFNLEFVEITCAHRFDLYETTLSSS